jgi:hypothetical protein
MTLQEALDLALELPMAISNLNGMFWSPVNIAASSNVKGAEYHRVTARLRITFPSGSYIYHGVSPQAVESLSAAKSAGSYVQAEFVKQPNVYPVIKE